MIISQPKLKKNASASKKKSQQRQQKNFISYAQKHGIEEAYQKYKGMDNRLLEEAVRAYCEKLGLEYISVADALKTVAKVEKGLSLLSKYTTICETIKQTRNVNEDAVKSSVGNSPSSSGHVTQGNSTTNGYTEPSNTNPGYVPPSTSNGIGTGTVQGSGSAFGK